MPYLYWTGMLIYLWEYPCRKQAEFGCEIVWKADEIKRPSKSFCDWLLPGVITKAWYTPLKWVKNRLPSPLHYTRYLRHRGFYYFALQDLVPIYLFSCSSPKENPNIFKHACPYVNMFWVLFRYLMPTKLPMGLKAEGEKSVTCIWGQELLTGVVQQFAPAGASIALLMHSWNSQLKHGDGVAVAFKKR